MGIYLAEDIKIKTLVVPTGKVECWRTELQLCDSESEQTEITNLQAFIKQASYRLNFLVCFNNYFLITNEYN